MANSKAGDENPFVYDWRVSFAPLREGGVSIGHPFGRTGVLHITAGKGNELNCLLDPDLSGQDFVFPATWEPGTGGGPASMTADVETGGRVYRFFAYLRPAPDTLAKGCLLGHLERLPRVSRAGDGTMDESDADGSWAGGDDEGGEEDPR